ncbi:hypothetical protein ACFE04_030687 [Oxalis oulophora]
MQVTASGQREGYGWAEARARGLFDGWAEKSLVMVGAERKKAAELAEVSPSEASKTIENLPLDEVNEAMNPAAVEASLLAVEPSSLEDKEPLSKRCKSHKIVESSLTKVSPPPSPIVPKIKHAHTRTMLAKWTKVGFLELTASMPIAIGLGTEANPIILATFAPFPDKYGEITQALSNPPIVSASQQGLTSTSGEAEESLHAILEGSEEEDDNGVNKCPSLDNRSPSKTTTSPS